MSANVNCSGALLQGATFSKEQLLNPDAIDFSYAMGNVNVVDADGLHLGQLDIGQVEAYRAGEVALSPGRADAMDAGRASAVDSVCQSYREAAAVHFAEVDTLQAAVGIVGEIDISGISLEEEHMTGPPDSHDLAAAAYDVAREAVAEAASLQTPEVQNVANQRSEEAGISV